MRGIAGCFVAWVLLAAGPACAEHVYMTATGQKQGPFRVDPLMPGKSAQQIPVRSVSHSIVSPRDPAGGSPTGKRQHKALVVTIPVGPVSPLFFSAVANNENLPSVVLQFMKKSRGGTYGLYYTIILTNANVAGLDLKSSEVDGEAVDLQEIALTYQKMEVRSAAGPVAMDEWETPLH